MFIGNNNIYSARRPTTDHGGGGADGQDEEKQASPSSEMTGRAGSRVLRLSVFNECNKSARATVYGRAQYILLLYYCYCYRMLLAYRKMYTVTIIHNNTHHIKLGAPSSPTSRLTPQRLTRKKMIFIRQRITSFVMRKNIFIYYHTDRIILVDCVCIIYDYDAPIN